MNPRIWRWFGVSMVVGLLFTLGSGCGDLLVGEYGDACDSDTPCESGLECINGICLRVTVNKDGGVGKKDGPLYCADRGAQSDGLPLAQCPVDWVTIKAGNFSMGSPAGEKCREKYGAQNKETRHQVTLSHGFEISAYEVTQGQFKLIMGYNPAGFHSCGAFCPVETVTWHEAVAYCNALSSLRGYTQCYSDSGSGKSCPTGTGCAAEEACVRGKCRKYNAAASYTGKGIYNCKGYRLPTEAEWEYAYRADSTTAYYNGDIKDCTKDDVIHQIAWYAANANSRTYPSCIKAPNKWNLYDMAGNVSEWIHDWYSPDLGTSAATDPVGNLAYAANALRGGDYKSYAHLQRASFRRSWSPWMKGNHVGFRCARSK